VEDEEGHRKVTAACSYATKGNAMAQKRTRREQKTLKRAMSEQMNFCHSVSHQMQLRGGADPVMVHSFSRVITLSYTERATGVLSWASARHC
jgi:hypothetical protein